MNLVSVSRMSKEKVPKDKQIEKTKVKKKKRKENEL